MSAYHISEPLFRNSGCPHRKASSPNPLSGLVLVLDLTVPNEARNQNKDWQADAVSCSKLERLMVDELLGSLWY
jgi:hypothetical protein